MLAGLKGFLERGVRLDLPETVIYVAWKWGACLLLFWRQFAPCSHGATSVSEEEVRMREHDVRWNWQIGLLQQAATGGIVRSPIAE